MLWPGAFATTNTKISALGYFWNNESGIIERGRDYDQYTTYNNDPRGSNEATHVNRIKYIDLSTTQKLSSGTPAV